MIEHIIESIISAILTKLVWRQVNQLIKRQENKECCAVCRYFMTGALDPKDGGSICPECKVDIDRIINPTS